MLTFYPYSWFLYKDDIYSSGYLDNLSKCVVKIKGFHAPIYIEVPRDFYTDYHLDEFITALSRINIGVKDYKLVMKHSLYGHILMYCYELNMKDSQIKRLRYNLKNLDIFKVKIHEHDIDFLVKFINIKNLQFCNWISIDSEVESVRSDGTSVIQTTADKCHRCELNLGRPSPKIFSFDIECEQIEDEENDESDDEDNSNELIFQISIVCEHDFKRTYYLLSLYDVEEKYMLSKKRDINTINIYICKNPKELIRKFITILEDENPDIITGYNINSYDWKVIINKCTEYNIDDLVKRSGRCYIPAFIDRKIWENTAYGKRDLCLLKIEGRSTIDLIQAVQRDQRLPSYSLNNVSKHFLNKTKIDIDYKLIYLISKFNRLYLDKSHLEAKKFFEPYKNHHKLIETLLDDLDNGKDIRESIKLPTSKIGKYCINDSLLVLELINKLQVINTCIELSNVVNIPIEDIYSRGNQYRGLCLVYKECRNNGLVSNQAEGHYRDMNNQLSESYSGAYVINPIPGIYNSVIVLDFNSLYPNIIINNNICYTTLITSNDLHKYKEYNTIDTINAGVYYFMKTSVRKGIIPIICEYLINNRKDIRKLMKTCDSELKSILECRQLALKITVNSIYGIMGTKAGNRRLAPGAACITYIGQNLLKETKVYIENELNFSVIYGDTDSVLIKVPYDYRNNYSSISEEKDIFKDDPILEKLLTDDEIKKFYETFDNLNNFCISRMILIGKCLSKKATSNINKIYNSKFLIEFEYCYNNLMLIKKKKYFPNRIDFKKMICYVKAAFIKKRHFISIGIQSWFI